MVPVKNLFFFFFYNGMLYTFLVQWTIYETFPAAEGGPCAVVTMTYYNIRHASHASTPTTGTSSSLW